MLKCLKSLKYLEFPKIFPDFEIPELNGMQTKLVLFFLPSSTAMCYVKSFLSVLG